MGKMMHKILGISIIAAGLALFLYPDIKTFLLDQKTGQAIEEFEEAYGNDYAGDLNQGTDTECSADDSVNRGSESLLAEVSRYNTEIYENGQEDFKDAWAVTQVPVVLDGLEDSLFGYIEIPTMEVRLPLYVGATSSNMAKGAVVLGETSLPVGGENTNSVIAGHRGYQGAPYFRDIEKLNPGDEIIVTNPWGTLYYQVESAAVILPDDSNAVRIQEGRDMVTLLTCHPYRSHGKYRYVVYCVRTDGPNAVSNDESGSERDAGWIAPLDGISFHSSADDIRMEQILRKCGAMLILVMAGFTAFKKLMRKKNNDEW